jgi:hypothetical protein
MARSHESLWLGASASFTAASLALLGVNAALDTARSRYEFWTAGIMIGSYAAGLLACICFLAAMRQWPVPLTADAQVRDASLSVSAGESRGPAPGQPPGLGAEPPRGSHRVPVTLLTAERGATGQDPLRVRSPGPAMPELPHLRTARERPVFIQYTNPEVLACYGTLITREGNRPILDSAIRATRLAVLCTDRYLVIPASSVFEVPGFSRFLDATAALLDAGVLRYVASMPGLEEYRDSKIPEYRSDGSNPYIENRNAHLRWNAIIKGEPRRAARTAGDIAAEWSEAIEPGGYLHSTVEALSRRWRGRQARFTRIVNQTPERLEDRAFIGRFVRQAIAMEFAPAEAFRIDFFLSRSYLRSYLTDLDANMLVDFPARDLSFGLHAAGGDMATRLISATALTTILKLCKIDTFVRDLATWEELLALRAVPELGLLSLRAFSPPDVIPVGLSANRAARGRPFRAAISRSQAAANVRRVADELLSGPGAL